MAKSSVFEEPVKSMVKPAYSRKAASADLLRWSVEINYTAIVDYLYHVKRLNLLSSLKDGKRATLYFPFSRL